MNAIVTDAGASCADTSPPCPIDVVALSAGLPDGTYYAGKRLTPWMSSDDNRSLRNLSSAMFRDTPEKAQRYDELVAMRAAESLTVRWTIEGGIPSTPRILTAGAAHLTEGVRDETDDAFRWGPDHYGTWLAHFFLHEVIEQAEHRFHDPGHERNSNDYIDAMAKRVDAFGDRWILAQIEIAQLIYKADLRATRARYRELCHRAVTLGIDVLAVLDGRTR